MTSDPPPVSPLTIPARLKYFADNFPSSESFVFFTPHSRDVITYGRLYQLAARFARRLRDQGFRTHDVIANTLPNCPERLVTDMGIAFAGCTPINAPIVMASGEDFFDSAQKAKCRGVVVCPSDRHHAWRLLRGDVTDKGQGLFGRLSCTQAEELTTVILVSRGESEFGCSLIDALSSGESYVADVTPEDIGYVFTTSGSTGFSKLVPRTNKFFFGLVGQTTPGIEKYNLEHQVSNFNDRPLGWFGGFPSQTYAVGQRRMLIDVYHDFDDYKDKAALTWKILKEETMQIPYILPADLYKLLDYVGEISEDDRVGIIGTGSQPMMKSLVRDMFKITKSVFLSYGLTETGIVAYKYITDIDNFTDFCAGKSVVEDIRIVNEKLEDCKPGEMGTVWVKDPGVVCGYLGSLRSDVTFKDDGWFDTHDCGYLDAGGELFVLGRRGDVITHGPHPVYPGWLEAKMAAHPHVSEAVVVAVSDPVMFHEICACVKPSPGVVLTEAAVRRLAADVLVAGEDTPTPRYFLVVSEMPRCSTGKTDRRAVGRMAEAKYGKQGES